MTRYILGLDIGGANTKYALIKEFRGSFRGFLEADNPLLQGIEYFPVWQKSREDIPQMLSTISDRVNGVTAPEDEIDCVVTITAELSDAFFTRREGILEIVRACEQVFSESCLHFYTVDGTFIQPDVVPDDPLSLAASNWVATARFVANIVNEETFSGLLIDLGSTTLDLIPLINGVPVTNGKDDTTRLLSGELVYTGLLRATIPSVSSQVPLGGVLCPISFEKFALMADIYYLLGDISGEDYTCDTADGRPVTRENSLNRVAHIVCGDVESITEAQILEICEYLRERHLGFILDAISGALNRCKSLMSCNSVSEVPIIVTGIGSKVIFPRIKNLITPAVRSLEELLSREANVVSTAVAVAYCWNMNSQN